MDDLKNTGTALEQFNGQTILDKWVHPNGSGFAVSYSAPQETFINQVYDALKSSVYGALVTQTRLKPCLGSKCRWRYKVDSNHRSIRKGWIHKWHIKISLPN